MREVDPVAAEETGPNLFQMMENAGRGLALAALEMLPRAPDGPTVVVAGVGGNGGGGIAAASQLANRDFDVLVTVTDEAGSGTCRRSSCRFMGRARRASLGGSAWRPPTGARDRRRDRLRPAGCPARRGRGDDRVGERAGGPGAVAGPAERRRRHLGRYAERPVRADRTLTLAPEDRSRGECCRLATAGRPRDPAGHLSKGRRHARLEPVPRRVSRSLCAGSNEHRTPHGSSTVRRSPSFSTITLTSTRRGPPRCRRRSSTGSQPRSRAGCEMAPAA
jgi:hypothetical protein